MKPRTDKVTLAKYSEGVIALSGCIAGEIPTLIIDGDLKSAENAVKEFITIFGRENFFLEIQNHGMPEEAKATRGLVELSHTLGVGLVATNDVHYLKQSDAKYQDILMCIQMSKTVNDKDRIKFSSDEYYLKSAEEMERVLGNFPEAIENTVKIADMCNVEIEFGNYHLPKYPLPENVNDAFLYLSKLCQRGLYKRYGDGLTDEMSGQLSYELNTIKEMGFVDYFLIVWDFIKYAKDNKIPVGPGRGSAAGSMVAYCLGITDIDPYKYGLLFERFLNPERITMPDIDIDFCYERRAEVISYVIEKYGKEKVAQIITFGTMKARQAVRDVGRVLDVPYGEVDRISKLIPTELNMTIDKAIEQSAELKRLYDNDENARRIINTARELEGMPRHASTHAAGVVITSLEVSEYVPVGVSDNTLVTQFGMTTLEELGLLKMDFLGLRNLTIIEECKKSIEDEINITYDEEPVMKLISSGNTNGVFQLESAGMKSFMRELKPRSIEDIIAGISLYRPGPMDSIPKYLKNRENPEKIVYKHPLLKPILEVTYGCIVYQEQVMQIVRTLAGYSYGRADVLRRAMIKKKHDVMEKERASFIYGDGEVDGAVKRGVDEKTASEIFDEMVGFAEYAFNKSHAAAYAHVAYQTAWLKTFYPVSFMAASFSAYIGDNSKIAKYYDEMKKNNIKLLLPDVNESAVRFKAEGRNIRYGLEAIKGVGRSFSEEIVRERKNGKFTGLKDFCTRMAESGLNKRTLESLVRSGAFDSLGGKRSQYLVVLEKYADEASASYRTNLTGQISLTGEEVTDELPELLELDKEEILNMEQEMLGVFVSGHPLDEYRDILNKSGSVSVIDIISAFEESESNIYTDKTIVLSAVITKRNIKRTKRNDRMAFITVEDLSGAIEAIVFPSVFAKCEKIIDSTTPLMISGKIEAQEDGQPKIIVSSFSEIEQETSKLYIKIPAGSEEKFESLKKILEIFKGDTPVYLYYESTKKTVKAPKNYYISCNDTLICEIKKLLGEGADAVLKNNG